MSSGASGALFYGTSLSEVQVTEVTFGLRTLRLLWDLQQNEQQTKATGRTSVRPIFCADRGCENVVSEASRSSYRTVVNAGF